MTASMRRRPMAVVRDDGAKVLGLITLEDLLEEIVGEIEDEHDRPPSKVGGRRKRPSEPGSGLGGGP